MKIQAQTAVRQPAGFAYAMQKDVYADFLFSNDVARTNKGETADNNQQDCFTFFFFATVFGSQKSSIEKLRLATCQMELL